MDYNCSDYDSSSMYSDESGLELPSQPQVKFRQRNHRSTEQSTSYRFSMANLEESHEAELDAILSELSLLEQHAKSKQINNSDKMASNNTQLNHNNIVPSQTLTNEHDGRAQLRTNSRISSTTNSTISISSSDICSNGSNAETSVAMRESRTDSPDNDSAFSDTVSLLSSESSTSSGICSSTGIVPHTKTIHSNLMQGDSAKNAKIQLALQKLEQASIRRLFVKAFTVDGASKSLLVDENMSCGHVTRLLADKNHVQMEPHWALVEHLPELQMERLFEDHEMLVDNLMDWNNDQKNRVLFLQRSDKVALFNCPEKFLNSPQMASGNDYDEHSRSLLLDEHFSSGNQIALEGPLYVKIDSKKVWKRYHFVLRASGIYYYPKEKTKSPRDLLCHSLFAGNNVYKGFGWKKKHKAPTEYTFALKPEKEPLNGSKSQRGIKMLCAEDAESLEKWVTAIRVAKYGKDLLLNHRALLSNLAREEMEKFSSNRCNSIGSIISSVPSQCSNDSTNSLEKNNNNNNSNSSSSNTSSNGRMSRSSSSSSSGCLSDADNAFDSDFPTGTIKRKPSMKPNLPLTSMTRQLKEVGENTYGSESSNPASPERGGTLTRRHSYRRNEDSCGSNNSTLKRRPNNKVSCSIESMTLSTPTPGSPCTPTAIHSGSNNNSVDALPISPLEVMPSCMTDSMFSLPPPPDDENTMTGSTFSLDSLPAPPSANELNEFLGDQPIICPMPTEPVYYISDHNINNNNNNNSNLNTNNSINLASNNNALPLPKSASEMDECDHGVIAAPLHESNTVMSQPIYISSMKSSIKAPPYKSPPAYNNDTNPMVATNPTQPQPKTVKFADSPVLLRRKVCFEDEVFNNQQQHQSMPLSPRRTSTKDSTPMPPPRSDRTRLSTTSSPKRLTESMSNPPSEFLHDLQRVMRKKWQIAQKCQSEPATLPHEVLGFRDFDANGPQIEYHDSAHFYRESSNVSNWVQEHYGNVVVDNLYENLGIDANDKCPLPQPILKKRAPPPIPKRDSKTVLTHRT